MKKTLLVCVRFWYTIYFVLPSLSANLMKWSVKSSSPSENSTTTCRHFNNTNQYFALIIMATWTHESTSNSKLSSHKLRLFLTVCFQCPEVTQWTTFRVQSQDIIRPDALESGLAGAQCDYFRLLTSFGGRASSPARHAYNRAAPKELQTGCKKIKATGLARVWRSHADSVLRGECEHASRFCGLLFLSLTRQEITAFKSRRWRRNGASKLRSIILDNS